MMSAILAIETSTEACSAALWIDEKITSRYAVAPQQHARLILPMCDELLKEAGLSTNQLNAVAFAEGPGSFTGVRIAAAVAQGIALAHQLPVIPISSLRALAFEAVIQHGATQILAGIDARMREVYWASFIVKQHELTVVQPEQVVAPDKIELPHSGKWFGIGTAWRVYGDDLSARLGKLLVGKIADGYPTAQAVATLAAIAWKQGRTCSAQFALPVYLRDKVVAE